MRRALTTLFASAVLAAGLSLAAPADASGYGYSHDRGRYDDSCRCYRSSDLGYWERPSDRRRWNRHNHRRHRQPSVHYYPGYGYYPGADHGYRRGHGRRDYGHHGQGHAYGPGRDGARSAWCARTYRSYDWRSGTYMTYDGRRVYCG